MIDETAWQQSFTHILFVSNGAMGLVLAENKAPTHSLLGQM